MLLRLNPVFASCSWKWLWLVPEVPGLGWISQTLAQPAHFIYTIRACRLRQALQAVCWLGAGQEWDRTPAAGNCEHLQAAAATKSIPAHSKHVLSGKAAANSQSETQHKFANMSLSSLPTAGKVIFLVFLSVQAKQAA